MVVASTATRVARTAQRCASGEKVGFNVFMGFSPEHDVVSIGTAVSGNEVAPTARDGRKAPPS
jgi:hypothetical protein